MRTLMEHELKLVQQSLVKKDINSAELLMEIYDHFISHLERFPEDEFDSQLNELNKTWSFSVCENLQKNLFRHINNSIKATQWKLIKGYFSWPKIVFTISILIAITVLANTLDEKIRGMILFMPTLIFLSVFIVYEVIMTMISLKKIKKIFEGSELKISSIFSRYFLTYLLLPILIFNILINPTTKFGTGNLLENYQSNYLIVTLSFCLCLFSITLYKAWKIKSKTALL